MIVSSPTMTEVFRSLLPSIDQTSGRQSHPPYRAGHFDLITGLELKTKQMPGSAENVDKTCHLITMNSLQFAETAVTLLQP
jgi:hypothetical protein